MIGHIHHNVFLIIYEYWGIVNRAVVANRFEMSSLICNSRTDPPTEMKLHT